MNIKIRSILSSLSTTKYVLLLFVSHLFSYQLHAQQRDVWQGVNNKKQKLNQSVQKRTGLVKSWMQHIQDWGLDESYRHELSLGANLHTNGFGGHLRYVQNKGNTTKSIWLLNVNTVKHEKEIKQQRKGDRYRDLGTFRPYHLGKMNSILDVKIGYGKEQVLLPSIIDDNIAVVGSIIVGAAIIVQKPVYLNLIYTNTTGSYIESEKYNTSSQNQFLSNASILGADKWTKGLGESKFIPGIFLEPALVFVPAKNKTFIQRIYVGANLSYYTNKIEIMALQKAKPYHTSFFVGLGLGKRWK